MWLRIALLIAGVSLLLEISRCDAQEFNLNHWYHDLPNTGRVWSILENQAFWIVTEPLDTAGLQTGTLPAFGSLGSSWTENRYSLNGFNITDSYIPGRPLLDPHLEALSSVEVETLFRSIDSSGSGADIQLKTSIPSGKMQSASQLFFSGNFLQSSPELSDELGHIVDASFHSGGIPNSKRIPFFVSAFVQDLEKTPDSWESSVEGNAYGFLAAASILHRENADLEILYIGQHLSDSNAGFIPFTEPEATTRDSLNTHVVQLRGNRHGWKGGIEFLSANLSSAFQNTTIDSILDLPSRHLSGSALIANDGSRLRLEGLLSNEKDLGNHHLTFNFRFEWNKNRNQWEGRTQRILVEGLEVQTLRWNNPAETSAQLENLSLSAADVWRLNSWIKIPAGLQFAFSHGNEISWNGLNPQVGMEILIPGRGPRIFGGWSRYGHLLQGHYLDFGNPDSPSGGFYEGETLIRRFGGPFSAMNPDLKQPYTDQIVVEINQQIAQNWHFGLQLFLRNDHQLIGLVNGGVPDSTYIPEEVTDPGNDGIEGTPDDTSLILFNRDPATFGEDFFLLTNPGNLSNRCKGFRIWIEKTIAENWKVSADFAGTKSEGTTIPGNFVWQNDPAILPLFGNDPNDLILAKGTTFFDRGFIAKLAFSYHFDRGIRLGAVARYYDGLPFGRLFFVPDFNQGPVFVRTTPRNHFPDGFRTQFHATLDVRAAYDLHQWTAIIDCFNLLNMSNNLYESDLTGDQFLTRVPIEKEAPRTVRMGLQYRF